MRREKWRLAPGARDTGWVQAAGGDYDGSVWLLSNLSDYHRSMPRRSRTRRLLKWVASLICLLILTAWFGTGCGLYAKYESPAVQFVLSRGCIWAEVQKWGKPWWEPTRQRWEFCRVWWPVAWPEDLGLLWGPDFYWEFPAFDANRIHYGSSVCVHVPCWLLFAVFSVPTALLWYVDRGRIQPGHCGKCDYDLTGNVSGRCPECGQAWLPPGPLG